QLSRKPEATPPTETGPAPAVAAILVGGLFWFSMGSAVFARPIFNSDAVFPPTPALSPGERENHAPMREHSKVSGQPAFLMGAPPTLVDEASSLIIAGKRGSLSPFHEGEDQGEGELDAALSALQPAHASSEPQMDRTPATFGF